MRHSLFFKNTDYNFLGQIVVFDLQTSFRYVVYILFLLALYNSILLKKNVKEFFHFSGTLPKWLCFNNSAKKSKADIDTIFDVTKQLERAEKETCCKILEMELERVLEEIKKLEDSYTNRILIDFGFTLIYAAVVYKTKSTDVSNLSLENPDIYKTVLVLIGRSCLGVFGARFLIRFFCFDSQSWKLSSLYSQAERLRRLMAAAGCKERKAIK